MGYIQPSDFINLGKVNEYVTICENKAYQKGRTDVINEIDNILNADMTISEVNAHLIRFIDKAKGRNRNDLDKEQK